VCYRPKTTRRWCTKCKDVTSWQLDRSIGHSRCIQCHSTSEFAKKVKRDIQEEPKLNKQYVKEQIEAAICELQEEYDKKIEECNKKITNICQCPDCGAVTFRDSEHICLSGKIQETQNVIPRKTIGDYILSEIFKIPPEIDDVIDSDSGYTSQGIVNRVISAGCMGTKHAISSALSDMVKQKKIYRRAATIKITTTSKSNKKFEKEISGFIYWRK